MLFYVINRSLFQYYCRKGGSSMAKNIEIQIDDEVYNRLKIESAKHNMDVEKYISVAIEKYNHNIRENYNYIEEKVKKPLRKILTDLEEYSGNGSENGFYNKILLLPLKIYTKPLPRGFNRILNYYKSKGWYNIECFYLITDTKSIIGYLGLCIVEEDAPYGKYLFIYGLNLSREYQNNTNLNYIINYIKSIGRKNQCYSIDIVFENSNLTYEQLNRLGFQVFSSVDIVGLNNIALDYEKMTVSDLTSEKCDIESIKDLVPIARIEPLQPLLGQWKAQRDKIDMYHHTCKMKGEEVEFLSVREDKVINNTLYHYFTLLVDTKLVFDDKYIKKVISILISMTNKEEDKERDYIISIPKEVNKNLSIYKEDHVLDSLNWLRKNNS